MSRNLRNPHVIFGRYRATRAQQTAALTHTHTGLHGLDAVMVSCLNRREWALREACTSRTLSGPSLPYEHAKKESAASWRPVQGRGRPRQQAPTKRKITLPCLLFQLLVLTWSCSTLPSHSMTPCWGLHLAGLGSHFCRTVVTTRRARRLPQHNRVSVRVTVPGDQYRPVLRGPDLSWYMRGGIHTCEGRAHAG